MTEEERAREARALHRRQEASRETIGKKLAGSQSKMHDLEQAWAPVVLALLEARQAGEDDADTF